MSNSHSHCRLCAKPSARSRLVCVDDEVIDIKQKMLLVNVDVSAPSPLPRGVCYSCLCLLDKTAAFRAQVSAAQDKLALIYHDNKDIVEETDYMDGDFDFSVKEEPQDDESVVLKPELSCEELPQRTRLASMKKKRGRPRNDLTNINGKKSDINKQKPPDIAGEIRKRGRPRKEYKNIKNNNKSDHWDEKKEVKRKYLCECGKVCQSPSMLKEHQRIHLERTKDYICHVCGKSFLGKSSLNYHLLTHKAKRYKCEVCGKSFYLPSRLKRHATQHSSERPFECDQCGKTFTQKRHLASHCLIHSDLRPHICRYCDKGFKVREHLIIHLRKHTGLRPHCCEHCGKGFYNYSSHHTHVRKVHGADPLKKKEVYSGGNGNDFAK